MFRDRDSQYMKEKFVINDFDLKSYTGQWCSQDIRKNIELIQKMNKTKNPLIIMKALRASSTYFEFLQKVDI